MSGPRWYDALAVGGMVLASIASALWLFRLVFELVALRPMVFIDWVETFATIIFAPVVFVLVHGIGHKTLTGRWPE